VLPAGLSLVSANPSQGTYNNATGLWSVGAVSTATPQTLQILAQVVSPNAQTNTASVSQADQFDPNPNNNTASASETPQQADLVHATTATLTIPAKVVTAKAQTNNATITQVDQFDPNPDNNSASATETPQQADLALTKTVNNATPNVGDTITFTVQVGDLGPN